MNLIPFPEISALNDQPTLFRVLDRFRRAFDLVLGTLEVGVVTLQAGQAVIHVKKLSPGSVIVFARRRVGGTAGTLYIDPIEYQLASGNAFLRSTSSTDTSEVGWIHWS